MSLLDVIHFLPHTFPITLHSHRDSLWKKHSLCSLFNFLNVKHHTGLSPIKEVVLGDKEEPGSLFKQAGYSQLLTWHQSTNLSVCMRWVIGWHGEESVVFYLRTAVQSYSPVTSWAVNAVAGMWERPTLKKQLTHPANARTDRCVHLSTHKHAHALLLHLRDEP